MLGRSVAYTGYLTLEKLRIRLADGSVVPREIEAHGDAAAVLPYDMGWRYTTWNALRAFGRAPAYRPKGSRCSSHPNVAADRLGIGGGVTGEGLDHALHVLHNLCDLGWRTPGGQDP
jgi:hypothetical protein